MKRLILPVIILSVIFFASCYYDTEEALYPPFSNTCDTSYVSFSGQITSILSNTCWSCHSDATAANWGNNIIIVTYGDVTSQINTILPSINHTGTKPMPKDSPKLLACQLKQFEIWVRNKMPDN